MNFQKRLGTILVSFLMVGFLAQSIPILNAQDQKPEINVVVWLETYDHKPIIMGGYTTDTQSNSKRPYLAIQSTSDMSPMMDISANLVGQTGPITAISGGRDLATGGEDGTVAVWNFHNRDGTDPSLQLLAKLDIYHTPIDSIAWAPDFAWLAVLARGKEISIWEIYDNDFHIKEKIPISKTGQISWDEIVPDGNMMDYNVKLTRWNSDDTTTYTYKTSTKGSIEEVSEHDFPNAQQAGNKPIVIRNASLTAIASPLAHKIDVYDSKTYSLIRTIPLTSSPTSLVWNSLEKYFAYADDKAVRIVNDVTGYELANYPIGTSGSARVIGWIANESQLAFLDAQNVIHFVPMPDINYIWDVAWSPDGKWIATGGWHSTSDFTSVSALFSIRNAADMSLVLDFSTKLPATTETILSIDWSPDGKYLVSGSQDGKIAVWAINDPQYKFGDSVAEFGNYDYSIGQVAWSPDGKWIAATVDYEKITIWNATNNDYHLTDSSIHIVESNNILWSPDSKWLTNLHSGCSGIYQISSTGTVVPNSSRAFFPDCNGDTVTSGAAWNPQSTQIALTAAFTNKLYIYDVTTAAILHTMDVTSPASPIVWSPDGTKLAYGTSDSIVHVMQTDTYNELATYVSGEYNVSLRLAWKPDSTALAFVNGENKPYPTVFSVPDIGVNIPKPLPATNPIAVPTISSP